MSYQAAKPIDKASELSKGRIAPSKVRRYRPGQVPKWAQQGSDEEEDVRVVVAEAEEGAVQKTDVAAPVIIARPDDPRLARLAQQPQRGRRRRRDDSDDEDADEDEASAPKAPRIVRPGARSPSAEADAGQPEEEEEEDEEELELRRAALRARLKAQSAAQEVVVQEQPQAGEEEEEEEEESSEYETDSEEEGHLLMKPVFVPKTDRETIVEREALEHEFEVQQEKAKQRAEERKVETRQLVVEIINTEATATTAAAEDMKTAMDLVVTDDEEGDADDEFEAWKARELARIRRSREEAKKEEEEVAERARWQALTDEEKVAEKAKDAEAAAGKKKWRFMQKYWHKGAFFQDDADDAFASTSKKLDILDRDYNAPTGEDKLDRTLLPEVMQVKNFGRRGRTKWTHLKNEDTTDFNAPWATDPNLRNKYQQKMAGTGKLDKPRT